MPSRGRNSVFAVSSQIFLFLYTAIAIYPLLTMVTSSLKSTREIFRNPFALPEKLDLNNFSTAWDRAHFSTYLTNTVVVTGVSVFVIILVGVLASYPLSRYKLRGLNMLFMFFLLGLMLPIRLGVVKLFMLMRDLNLLDSLLSLILIYVAMRIPFSVFIITNFMKTIPAELEDAARIDGCNELQILTRILTPLVRPAIAIVTIFSAIAIWNDFYFPFIFIYSDAAKTLPVGLASFFGQYQIDWGLLFAGLTISTVPLIVVYLAMSRHLVKGLSVGGIK